MTPHIKSAYASTASATRTSWPRAAPRSTCNGKSKIRASSKPPKPAPTATATNRRPMNPVQTAPLFQLDRNFPPTMATMFAQTIESSGVVDDFQALDQLTSWWPWVLDAGALRRRRRC